MPQHVHLRRVFLLLALLLPFAVSPAAAAEARRLRHPDYHNGKIVFSYQGSLWLVDDEGANPRRLTAHRARDIHPRFSPDGKWIAFSSARYGDYDVFIMPAEGGEAKRLTYHAASDTVVGWSRDSKHVVFSSARGRVFPGIPSLYEVSIDGGLEQPLPTDWGFWGSYSPNGQRFAFNRHPMVWSRKHYRGSYAADLWVMDLASKSSRKFLDATLPDDQKPNNFWPMYANGEIYFVSDREVMARAGSKEVLASRNNIWKIGEDGGEPMQVTHHTSGSLFWPSLSSDSRVIVYEEDSGLWKLDLGTGKSVEVHVNLNTDSKENNEETLTMNSEAESFHLSPSGKRAVISAHGEIFSIATERGDIRRLTHSPGARDGQPVWSLDGKWIAFVSDQSGRDEVWLCDEEGQNQKKISDSDSQKGSLTWSPDSKALLYTGTDKKLYRYDLADGKTRVLAQGEVIGFGGAAIMGPQWSPDGKWISYTRADQTLLPHVFVIPAEGGKEQRITEHDTYSDSGAVWTPDGKRIVYLSGGDVGNIGQAGQSTAQLYSVALVPEEKDPFNKGVDSEQEAAAAERSRPGGGRGGRGPGGQGEAGAAADGAGAGTGRGTSGRGVEVKIDFHDMGKRTRQLTRSGDTVSGLAVSPDSRTYVFTTTGIEGGRPVQSIWAIQQDGEGLTRVTQAGRATDAEGPPAGRGGFGGFSSLQFTKDSRQLYYRQGQSIYAINVPAAPASTGGETPAPTGGGGRGGRGGMAAAAAAAPAGSGGTPRRVTFTARVDVNHRAEHKEVFEESWRVMKHRFYDAQMHGVDWDHMKTVYEPLVPYAGDSEELHDIVSEMIGELNASHTGISGGRGGPGGEGQTQTRHPGIDLEPDASGHYKVTHVYKHGPADKDYVKIKAGDYVLAIDGHDLKAGDNYWKYYTLAPANHFDLTVNSKPAKEGAWHVKIVPISAMQFGTLQYDKWVDDREALVDKLSGGEVGYLHIRQMNEPSLRKFERDLARQHDKKALIIDQRFNPGGGIDQELLEILEQRQYQYTKVRDSVTVTRPLRGFFGPKVVMENERSTSDAEVFPDGFRTLHLGKVVGVTTYGAVIGTGAYQLMDGSTIRTPGSGLWNVNGTNLENYGVPPDIYVDNTPDDFLKGRDAQLEKAVEVLKEELRQKK
jgi:tricorn protease